MLYSVMTRRRTQLYLDEDQHRWLKQRAGRTGSIAEVVRGLIDAARAERPDPHHDPLIEYLLEKPPGRGKRRSSVTTLDDDLYGA